MFSFHQLVRGGTALGLCAALLWGCTGKNGEPGPQGDPGPAGAQGPQGPAGSHSFSRVKDGFVTGTITGFRKDGVTPLNESFRYEFYYATDIDESATIRETATPGVYNFHFSREDSLGTNVFNLAFSAPLDVSKDTATYANLRFAKDLGNNQLLHVDGDYRLSKGKPSVVTLTNLIYNANTNILTGNYTWNATPQGFSGPTVSYSSSTGSGLPFKVSGSFTIPLTRWSSFRKKAE